MRRVLFVPVLVVSLAVLSLFAQSARAAVPGTLNFQGVLRTSAGKPIADGAHDIRCTLYNGLLSTTPAWQEVCTVNSSQGVFSAVLGTATAITPDKFIGNDWMEIEVRNGATWEKMSPRTRMTPSPYAFQVATINGADGGNISGRVTASGPVSGTGSAFTLEPGVHGIGNVFSRFKVPGVLAEGDGGAGFALDVHGYTTMSGDLAVTGNTSVTGNIVASGNMAAAHFYGLTPDFDTGWISLTADVMSFPLPDAIANMDKVLMVQAFEHYENNEFFYSTVEPAKNYTWTINTFPGYRKLYLNRNTVTANKARVMIWVAL